MIVKPIKAAARIVGKVLDEEDRQLMGQGLAVLLALGIATIIVAGAAGLAIRVFEATQRF